MAQFIEKVADVVHAATGNAHDLARVTKSKVEEKFNVPCMDLTIQFISASGIPKMDVIGTTDPYFVAKIDDNVSMVSTVKKNTLTPAWNETWRVKNVPMTSELLVEVLDKGVGVPLDNYIGKFKTGVTAGAKELEIEGPLFRGNRGTFWLQIDAQPSADPAEPKYLFDGPIRYSKHISPTVGRLTNIDDAHLYSTWKMYLIGVPIYFKDVYQHWNVNYKAAQSIFGSGPTSLAIRAGIHAGHKLLYARSTSNGFGVIQSAADVLTLFHGGSIIGSEQEYLSMQAAKVDSAAPPIVPSSLAHRVKPAVYTYIVSAEDDSLRFSETGAAFFVDFASKHALHANCCERVRYSGEFHPRPRSRSRGDDSWVGWQDFNDSMPDDTVDWEVVVDNNSGTYSPDKAMLPTLKALLEHNFPGFGVQAFDREDEALKQSVHACRDYALKHRGVQEKHLQPHLEEGEESLMKRAGAEGSASAGLSTGSGM